MFFVFVCLFVVVFFIFSTLVVDIQQVWKKFVDFTGISRTPRNEKQNEKSESEERFKLPLQALPSNVGFFAPLNSTG